MKVFTKSELLSFTRPEQLFTEANFKKEYHGLSKILHPDMGGNATLFAHVTELYDKAQELATINAWGKIGVVTINGKVYAYHSKHDFDLGEVYTTDAEIVYFVKKEFLPLPFFSTITYPDDSIKKGLVHMVPTDHSVVKAPEGNYYIIPKLETAFLLKDIMDKMTIPVRHVAWIVSRLYNISCLLHYNKQVHLDINPISCLVDPTTHHLFLFGGWWYTTGEGRKLTAMPASTYSVIPPSLLLEKKASVEMATEQIKALGRELLGNRNGTFLQLKGAEPTLAEWFTSPGSNDPYGEFATWQEKTLTKAFGKRTFVKWDIDRKTIYGV